jgi:hypothetical protein
MDAERMNPEGTPTLGTLVLWAAQGAEADGAIGFDDLQELRQVAALLNEHEVDTVDALKLLIARARA